MRTLYALMSHVAQVAQNGSTESSTTVLSLWDRHEEGKRYMRWWSRLRSTRSPGWDTRCRSTVAVCVLGIIAHCIPSPLQSGPNSEAGLRRRRRISLPSFLFWISDNDAHDRTADEGKPSVPFECRLAVVSYRGYRAPGPRPDFLK